MAATIRSLPAATNTTTNAVPTLETFAVVAAEAIAHLGRHSCTARLEQYDGESSPTLVLTGAGIEDTRIDFDHLSDAEVLARAILAAVEKARALRLFDTLAEDQSPARRVG